MSGNIKEFSTYSLESPLIKLGSFVDSSGKTLKITPEVARDIHERLIDAAPLKDSHDDSVQIGQMKKFILKADGIWQKSLITDTKRFESRFKHGNCYISPELDVELDANGKVVGASLTGAALTNNPGMVSDMVKIEPFHFEAPSNAEPTQPVESTSTSTPSWTEPLGELKQTINTLNDTLSTFGERMNNSANIDSPESTPNTNDSGKLTLSVDDLAKIVDEAVSKKLASNTPSSPPPEASETKNDVDDVAEKYAKMVNELENLKGAQEKAYKKQFNAIVADLKAIGVEHPEKMLPDSGLSTEQKITILESIKENFAKNSPISAPLQEPLSGSSGGSNQKQGNALNVDAILASESFESDNDPQLRHKLLRLSDPELMRKYNMNVLFDTNGNYIGPL